MDLQQRIISLEKLGTWLRNYFAVADENLDLQNHSDILIKAKIHNGWFTPNNVKMAASEWGKLLTAENLENWLNPYEIKETEQKSVGVIMAGNIPLVGFHDFISVLLTGHKVLAKLSQDDKYLLPFITEKLIEIEPRFAQQIEWVERLTQPDAVIATGSNNTARYFESYFGKYPNIIRKNRNSVAVITGKETTQELKLLADDLFMYFGLGCRNITKLYLPAGYNLDQVFENIFHYKELGNHNKYGNNYDYYRAIYLMNKEPFLENGFAIMRENPNLGSPVAVINYEFYNNLEAVKAELNLRESEIQCVVSLPGVVENCVAFGETQKPALNDYADGVDTIGFLLRL